MNLKSKVFYIILFLSLCSAPFANAQLSGPCNCLDKIKNGNTHIVVDSLNFPGSEEFYEVFKKYWTVTKSVDYLKISELGNNLFVGDTYFSLQLVVVTANNGRAALPTVYLDLWTPNPKNLNKRPISMTQHFDLADILLPADRIAFNSSYDYNQRPDANDRLNFSGEGHLFNWDAGHFKNYLQQISNGFITRHSSEITDDVSLSEELKQLKKDTLFLNEDAFRKRATFVGDGKMNDTAGIFKKYKFPHKVLKPTELKEKILKSTTPFYYLIVVANGSKMIGVTNGSTGKLIYSKFYNFSRNIKDSDLKDLGKAIEKSEK